MRAVVFDLFGTLSDPAVEITRREVVGQTARALDVDPDLLWEQMRASFHDRIVGTHGGTRQTLHLLAQRCGARPTAEQFERALLVHLDGARRLRAPRPGALRVLDELRRRGYRIGVLSDCSSEVAEGWAASPYDERVDVAVLSWQESCRKPDPRLYVTATDRLGVPAQDCWYVGDGGGRELTGASAAGMTPVLVTNALVPTAANHRADPDDYRPSLEVPDLPDLLQLLGAACS